MFADFINHFSDFLPEKWLFYLAVMSSVSMMAFFDFYGVAFVA